MFEPYIDRLILIKEMLNSPQPEMVREAYESLFELYKKYADKPEFIGEMKQLVSKYPKIPSELEAQIEKLSKDNETEKMAFSLKRSLENLLTKTSLLTPEQISPSAPKGKLLWWYITICAFVLISAWAVINLLPNTNTLQKIVVALVAFSAMIMLPYILPQKDRSNPIGLSGIKLNYTTHTYISVGDQNTIDTSIENTGNTEFNGSITLIFQDPDSLVKPAPNEDLSAKIEVSPHGKTNRQFKFILVKKPLDGGLNFCFRITSSDGPQYMSSDDVYLITPMPYLRSIGSWVIGGSGVIALIIAFLWQLIVEGK